MREGPGVSIRVGGSHRNGEQQVWETSWKVRPYSSTRPQDLAGLKGRRRPGQHAEAPCCSPHPGPAASASPGSLLETHVSGLPLPPPRNPPRTRFSGVAPSRLLTSPLGDSRKTVALPRDSVPLSWPLSVTARPLSASRNWWKNQDDATWENSPRPKRQTRGVRAACLLHVPHTLAGDRRRPRAHTVFRSVSSSGARMASGNPGTFPDRVQNPVGAKVRACGREGPSGPRGPRAWTQRAWGPAPAAVAGSLPQTARRAAPASPTSGPPGVVHIRQLGGGGACRQLAGWPPPPHAVPAAPLTSSPRSRTVPPGGCSALPRGPDLPPPEPMSEVPELALPVSAKPTWGLSAQSFHSTRWQLPNAQGRRDVLPRDGLVGAEEKAPVSEPQGDAISRLQGGNRLLQRNKLN
ncbi:proline-rich protein 36-like [Vulpes lagopus]|uniref:proline-rich protein 36-like n=1 Tax=Vulpes lagopus TaxID=494514 RepID=UPI001BC9BB26|nr:proline-rich protein 36-like [Vulpes lagopus]